MTRQTRTTCPYCGVGCGLVGATGKGRSLKIAPDDVHPANEGRICSKAAALGETVGLEGRLLNPVVRGRTASWTARWIPSHAVCNARSTGTDRMPSPSTSPGSC